MNINCSKEAQYFNNNGLTTIVSIKPEAQYSLCYPAPWPKSFSTTISFKHCYSDV